MDCSDELRQSLEIDDNNVKACAVAVSEATSRAGTTAIIHQ
jgi:hypothetical protein